MKTLIPLLAAACFVGAAFAQQSNPPPAPPGPEAQRMAVWYGEWTYEGAYETTPLGPGMKFTGRMTGRSILNGFTGEFIYRENSAEGETQSFELNWYDPAARSYSYVVLGNDGSLEEGPFAFNGEVCTWEARGVSGGTPYKIRGTETMAPDKMSLTRKAEISVDGKTWLPYLESRYTKVKPAK